MKINFYALYDSDVGFMQPTAMANDKVAVRSFRQACEDSKPNMINQNAQNMSIWFIGCFDDTEGIFENNKTKLADAAPFVLGAKNESE